MSDFGEHLADMAADGCDVSPPVPYRPFINLRTRMGPPMFAAKERGNPIDISPAERAEIEREILNIQDRA